MNKIGMTYEDYSAHDDFGNAPHLLSADDEAAISRGDVKRVGGGCICTQCGKEYYDHPPVKGALWATRLCDGKLVKL